MSIFLLLAPLVFAQEPTINVKDIPATEETTISVQRGRGNPNRPRFEITEGTDDLAGDPAPLLKQARANWKKACDEWKVELKELNRENQILTLSCGSPSCRTETMETTCRSTSKHKLKVRVE